MRNLIFVLCSSVLLVAFCVFAAPVFADTPTISSFVASPTSGGSGQLVSFTWSGQNTGGYNLLLTCAPGVKIKGQDGSIFPCDSKNATTNQSSDSLGLYVINTSGTLKTLTARLYPKSTAGDEYTAGEKDQSLSVSPAPYPITNFSVSASSTVSGSPTSFSWTGPDLDGVNLMFACVDGVTVLSSDGTIIPCGKIAFDTKLSPSSSLSVSFKNSNSDRSSVAVTLLPYISDSAYDLTHSQSLTLDVASDKVSPPAILTFVSSRPSVASDDTLTLAWTTKNAAGANIKMNCADSLSAVMVLAAGNQPIMCNSLFSQTSLGASSSVTLILSNSARDVRTTSFTLMPQFVSGGFDGINTRSITVAVSPKGVATIVSSTTPVSVVATTTTTTLTPPPPAPPALGATTGKKITKALSFGSRNSDVTLLQQILSRDGTVYPEASVTGYFGPATLRAVQRFQVKHSISGPGQDGYGSVGPKTRSVLNSL